MKVLKCVKKILSLDDAGLMDIEVEVECGFDDAGFYEIKEEGIEVEHL